MMLTLKTLSLSAADQRDIHQLNVIKTSKNQVKSVTSNKKNSFYFTGLNLMNEFISVFLNHDWSNTTLIYNF